MSGTQYARPVSLRLTEDEADELARLVMIEIEDVSHREHDPAYLARLRSLLERLTR